MLPQHPLLASSLRYPLATATTTTISTFQHTSDTTGRHHAYVCLRLPLCSLQPPSSLLWWDEQQQSFTSSQLTNYCRPQEEEAWVQMSLSLSLSLSASSLSSSSLLLLHNQKEHQEQQLATKEPGFVQELLLLLLLLLLGVSIAN